MAVNARDKIALTAIELLEDMVIALRNQVQAANRERLTAQEALTKHTRAAELHAMEKGLSNCEESNSEHAG